MTLEALLMLGATWFLVTFLALRFFLRVLGASRNENSDPVSSSRKNPG